MERKARAKGGFTKWNRRVAAAAAALVCMMMLAGCPTEEDTPPGDPPLTGTVFISGFPKVDVWLTANIGYLGGSTAVSYEWKRSTTAATANEVIPGVTTNSYKPVQADVGRVITVTVSRTGFSGSITSPATAMVRSSDTPVPTVSSVTVTAAGGAASVAKGATLQFSASVAGTNSPPQTVAWTITTARTAGTSISDAGLLTVAAGETNTSLTVKAISTINGTTGGEKTVTVTGGSSGGGDAVTFGAVTYDVSTGNCSASFTYTGSDTPTAKMLFATDANKATANPMGATWATDQSEDMTIASGTASLTGSTASKSKYTTYANVYVVIKVGSGAAAKQHWYQLKPASSSGGDGPTWTAAVVAAPGTIIFGANAVKGIAWNGSDKFVAVGGGGTIARWNGTDPNWTRVVSDNITSLEVSVFGDINGIAYGGGKFVAVGNAGKIAYSTDGGVNWTLIYTGNGGENNSGFGTNTNVHINGIAWNGSDKFVAVGTSGRMATSPNGTDWTPILSANNKFTDGTTGISIYGIAYGNGKWVAVGGSGRIAHWDGSAENWTAVTPGTSSDLGNSKFGTSNIRGIAYGGTGANAKFVAVGEGGKMAYSTDGTTWAAVTNSTFDTSHIYGIAWGNNMFVAVGQSGKMAYSADGISWTGISATESKFGSSSNIIYGITYGGNKFVAVGQSGKMAYSN